MSLLKKDHRICERCLKSLGFRQVVDGRENIEIWERDGVEIWNFNDEFWLVDALDQAGIEAEFHTLGDLDAFWVACQKPHIIDP